MATAKDKKTAAAAKRAPHAKSGLYAAKEPRPLDEFDLDVLRLLPDEGAMKGRYMQDTLTVSAIKRTLDPTLTPEFVSKRLAMLRDQDLVVAIKVSSRGMGYQRTDEGKKVAIRGTLAE